MNDKIRHLELNDAELAKILASLAWDRKTHGYVTDSDSRYWLHRFKWWLCGLMWKEEKYITIHKAEVEDKIHRLCMAWWHKGD